MFAMKMDKERKTWEEFIDDGDKYLKTAVNGYKKRKNIFTPEIIYNIVSMSIEKYIMGYLLYHNRLPDNHTLADLITAVKEIGEVDNELYAKIIHMNRFQEICSLNSYVRKAPSEKDNQEFLTIGERVRNFVKDQIPHWVEHAI